MSSDLREHDVREFLSQMAGEMPTPLEVPPQALRRARSRFTRTVVVGTLVGALALAGAASGIRSILRAEPHRPADDTTTPLPSDSARFESPFYGYSIAVPPDWSAMPAEIAWSEGDPRRSDILNGSAGEGRFSFNVLIASIAIPEGMSADAWQEQEEEAFLRNHNGQPCSTNDLAEPIELDGISGRVATAFAPSGGCDFFATFVIENRGYVVSTAGYVAEGMPLIRSVLSTIRFEPDRAIAVSPGVSAWRGIWPQTTREAAERAQARSDAIGPDTAWQVDWNQDGIVAQRFVEEELGWGQARHVGVSYVPGDSGNIWEAEVVEWFLIRCEPGATNPLYPDDPLGGDCAPTIDETRYEQVVVKTEQLIRQDRTGISLVTGWDEVEPYVQTVPPSDEERGEALAFIDEFMRARVAGTGTESYLAPNRGRVFFLYTMRGGRPYGRYEVAEPGSNWVAGWPFGGFGTVIVRLFPETGGGCVIQRIGVDSRSGGSGTLFLYQSTGFSYFKGEYEEGSPECSADINTVRLPA